MQRFTSEWSQRLEALCAFHSRGRGPKRKAEDRNEASLAQFQGLIAVRYRSGKLSPECLAALNAKQELRSLVQSWDACPVKQKETEIRISSLAEFYRQHNRGPSRKSTDAHECALAQFQSNLGLRYRKKSLPEGDFRLLCSQQELQGLRESWDRFMANQVVRGSFDEKVRLLIAFVQTNGGELPKRGAPGIPERTFGAWLGHCRQLCRKGKLKDEHSAKLREVPGLSERIESWEASRKEWLELQSLDGVAHLQKSRGRRLSTPASASDKQQSRRKMRAKAVLALASASDTASLDSVHKTGLAPPEEAANAALPQVKTSAVKRSPQAESSVAIQAPLPKARCQAVVRESTGAVDYKTKLQAFASNPQNWTLPTGPEAEASPVSTQVTPKPPAISLDAKTESRNDAKTDLTRKEEDKNSQDEHDDCGQPLLEVQDRIEVLESFLTNCSEDYRIWVHPGDQGEVVRFRQETGSAFILFDKDRSMKHWVTTANFKSVRRLQAEAVTPPIPPRRRVSRKGPDVHPMRLQAPIPPCRSRRSSIRSRLTPKAYRLSYPSKLRACRPHTKQPASPKHRYSPKPVSILGRPATTTPRSITILMQPRVQLIGAFNNDAATRKELWYTKLEMRNQRQDARSRAAPDQGDAPG